MTSRPGPGSTEPGVKGILAGSPLIKPWRDGTYAQLSLEDVWKAVFDKDGKTENDAAKEVIRIAGLSKRDNETDAQAFIRKTAGGTLDPHEWSFYDLLPNVWPPITAQRDPYAEPINPPSTTLDPISQAASAAVSPAQLATKLDHVLADLAAIKAKFGIE